MSLESEQLEKWLQQLGIATILTTLCENVDGKYTHRVMMWRDFCRCDYFMRETGRNYTYSATEFYTISGMKKDVKKFITKTIYSINPPNFVILTTLCTRTMCITRVLEMSFWTVAHVGQSIRKKPGDENGSPWIRYARKIRGESVQDEAIQRLWNSAQLWKRSKRNLN